MCYIAHGSGWTQGAKAMAKWIVQTDAAGNGFEVTADICEQTEGALVFGNHPTTNIDEVAIIGCIASGKWNYCVEQQYASCIVPFTAEDGPSGL
jgi:hypothetical protein